jgi:sulfopyruvate decarboxylase TPP-binding subunit
VQCGDCERSAKIIFDGLKTTSINLIVTLPDINLARLLREVEEDRDVIHVPLCRGEEGIGSTLAHQACRKNPEKIEII